ncbi:uncharacterized protein N7529_006617 [Penicillium soppii]|uniref:uncharacterized protein n=1 Tax=Penicillium soppii TaxID=69789 RepID=UPI002546C92F|nr:uncharacterized protein N7529_006617 [Penicillium soppii]KAJ5864701.1 hypothetical protein N7529_006617 [Penicillium soppii]
MGDINLQDLSSKMQALLDAFEAHPECQPPNTNPTIFFVYDFVRNTHNQLKKVDAAKFAAGDSAAVGVVNEARGRNNFASLLINDTSGKMALMTGGDPSNPADFGAEVKARAADLA